MDQRLLYEVIEKAAKAIKEANALLFTSGAGLGVDSGLPDFRGPQGFWRAYPPMQKLGLRFEDMSCPAWFERDPKFAWGFWLHRYSLYTSKPPHKGYEIMREWGSTKPLGYFSFTSNVDGHWIKSGVPPEKVIECHGSVHYLQCTNNCTSEIWESSLSLTGLTFDEETFRATTLPPCKNCKEHIARPNVLMFGDFTWNSDRCNTQEAKFAFSSHNNALTVASYSLWLEKLEEADNLKLVVIEIGAGKAVTTVRKESESITKKYKNKATLIRINPRDEDIPAKLGDGHISIPLGGLEALTEINKLLNASLQ